MFRRERSALASRTRTTRQRIRENIHDAEANLSSSTTAATAALSSSAVGTTLNVDLYLGADEALKTLKTALHPRHITAVSLDYNLMAEPVSDREWMAVLAQIGESLPRVACVTLSFRVPVALPIQALVQLLHRTKSTLRKLTLSGLQLSTNASGLHLGHLPLERDLEALWTVFRQAQHLEDVHICRYQPVRCVVVHNRLVDPLLHALTQLPALLSLHMDRTDWLRDATTRAMIVQHTPMHTLKISNVGEQQQRRSTISNHNDSPSSFAEYLPLLAPMVPNNPRLQELQLLSIVQQPGIVALSQLLETNTSLQKVTVRVDSSDYGPPLAQCLAVNTTLQALEVTILSSDRNGFRQNAVIMAQALADHPASALVSLHLDGCRVKGIRPALMMDSLKAMLKRNYVLRELALCRGTVVLSPEVQFYLKLNRVGRLRLLRPDIGRNEWIRAVVGSRDDLGVVFYFLVRNPLILVL